MEIKVLGPGCKNCQAVEARVKEVLAELGISAEVQKVTDMRQIMEYDILMTPGLVINGKVKVFGRVPSHDEIREWIAAEQQ
ncbi:MAG: thioredoxin family protein [Moorellales bacterium]